MGPLDVSCPLPCCVQSFGLSRAVMLLKGSKSKQVEQWMQDLTALEGQKLHGAGSNRSEDWWKGLGNVLMGQGLLASKSKSVRRAFALGWGFAGWLAFALGQGKDGIIHSWGLPADEAIPQELRNMRLLCCSCSTGRVLNTGEWLAACFLLVRPPTRVLGCASRQQLHAGRHDEVSARMNGLRWL